MKTRRDRMNTVAAMRNNFSYSLAKILEPVFLTNESISMGPFPFAELGAIDKDYKIATICLINPILRSDFAMKYLNYFNTVFCKTGILKN